MRPHTRQAYVLRGKLQAPDRRWQECPGDDDVVSRLETESDRLTRPINCSVRARSKPLWRIGRRRRGRNAKR